MSSSLFSLSTSPTSLVVNNTASSGRPLELVVAVLLGNMSCIDLGMCPLQFSPAAQIHRSKVCVVIIFVGR